MGNLLRIAAATAIVACGSSAETSGDGSESAVNATSETCTATFTWLQKDAYKSTGGRGTALWPPHTTTTLDVRCVGANGNETFTKSAFKDNHGSAPGSVDANGAPFLVETKRAQAKGGREQMKTLLAAYEGCGCEAATRFLSLDVVKEDEASSAKKILDGFADYAKAHLTCPDDGATALGAMLRSGDFERALEVLPSCSWAKGYDISDGFVKAAQGVVGDLSKFHVCNNDAQLEAALFAQFAANGTAAACDATREVCEGPAFFYTP